jgi:hypothetical protein
VELKLPHAPALPQVAVQSTPRLFGSPATFAASVVCDASVNAAPGAVDIVTIIGAVVTMVAVAEADTVGFVVDFAVMVTCPPGGTVEGPA